MNKEKPLRLEDCEFMKTPIGANKRYLVTMDGNPIIGMNTIKGVRDYIRMMTADKHKPKPPYCSTRNWSYTDRGEY